MLTKILYFWAYQSVLYVNVSYNSSRELIFGVAQID